MKFHASNPRKSGLILLAIAGAWIEVVTLALADGSPLRTHPAIQGFILFTGLIFIPPATFFVRQKQKLAAHRQSHGLCRICGYDLRATPNRCPECGTLAQEKAPT
jgi:hypothetical protein